MIPSNGEQSLVRIFKILAAILVTGTIASSINLATLGGRHVDVSLITPEQGFAYIGSLSVSGLSDQHSPTGALLFIVETKKGSVIRALEPMLGGSYLFQYVATLLDYLWLNQTHEIRREIGPGNTQHSEVREKGDGRYSVWGGLVFSLPGNIPLKVTERLELVVPVFPVLGDPYFRRVLSIVLNTSNLISAIGLALLAIVRLIPPRYFDVVVRNTAPGFIVTLILLICCAVVAEFYLQKSGKFPLSEMEVSTFIDPQIGPRLVPGGKIKWTNGTDFWVEEKANSLGLADNEPAIPKPPGTYRILIVGPSFVEALQVPNREKFQSLLSIKLKAAYPNRSIDVVTLGMSGTSQSNQLAAFEQFKNRLQPNLVLLLFALDDFANNSVVLDSIRQGWNPQFPPFLFFETDADGQCSRIPIAPDFQKHLIPGTETQRRHQIEMMSPAYKHALEGWDPEKQSMDLAFAKENLPAPVFYEALDLTRCALADFMKYAQSDGFRLAAVAAEHLSTSGQIGRLRQMLAELQIPLFDLFPKFEKGGLTRAIFPRDQHWNTLGHRWVAEELFDQLKASGYLEEAVPIR